MSYEPGAAAGGMIPLSVPEIRGNEWKYVKDCLDTGWVSSGGSYVDRFERMVAEYSHTRYAVAAVNGTAALHIALLVAGVEANDEVVTSDVTFVAPANAIRYVNAWPRFIDAEPRYYQMDANRLADFLDNRCEWKSGALWNKSTGRRVRAILPVHILGHPVDLAPILELAAKYELPVIEDATEALGATYKGKMVGSEGHIACFSFNGNKIITTGGGGMIVTNDARYAEHAKYLTTQAKDDPVEYVHGEIGFNYRLTNVLAAIGCAQMEQLVQYVETKKKIAARYERAFSGVPGITAMQHAGYADPTFWLYTIAIEGGSREAMHRLTGEGVQTRPLWRPMHMLPTFKDIIDDQYPVAEQLNKDCLSIPCSVGLTDAEQTKVIDAITSVVQPLITNH